MLLTHALALSASQFVHKKNSPTNLYEYALGGARTHETGLYQARRQPDTPPGRPDILIVSRVDFVVFVLFLESWCEGVLLYCRMAVENRFCASRVLREQCVLALEEPSSQRVGGFGLRAESYVRGKPRSWSCTQPRAAKATADVAVAGTTGSIPRTAADL